MDKYYDKRRKESPKYKVGNLVMLNSKNLKMHHLTKKFDHKMLRLVRMDKVIASIPIKLRNQIPGQYI
jgi:hypothetical protein